jgi:maleylpyruvate isomerase
MRLHLLTRWQNSAGERVRIALHLKGVPYEYVPVSSLPAEEWQRLNPQGLMPALLVDGRALPQSSAILEFLEEAWPDPPLLPAEPLFRAEARAFAALIASDLHPLNNNRVRRYLAERVGADEAALRDWYAHWVRVAFEALEAALAARPEPRPFCFSDAPGWADLHLTPQMANARRFGCDLEPYPLLRAVDARCQDLNAFRRARPEAQPDFPGAGAPSVPDRQSGV